MKCVIDLKILGKRTAGIGGLTSDRLCRGWWLSVTEEGEEAEQRLLIRAGGQTRIGGDQIVDNTPEIRLQQLPPVLDKTLTFVSQTLLWGKLK